MNYFNDYRGAELYHPNRSVPAGVYKEVRTGRVVRLETNDTLPASLDGRVATYVRISVAERQVSGADQPGMR